MSLIAHQRHGAAPCCSNMGPPQCSPAASHCRRLCYRGQGSRYQRAVAAQAAQRPQTQLTKDAAAGLLAAALAVSCLCTPAAALAEAESLYDGARIFNEDKREQLAAKLDEFNRSGPWRVRVFTQYQLDRSTSSNSPRQLWGPLGQDTLVLQVDPSSPNILNLSFIGDEVLFKLRRPFLSELVTRFGNMFYVREQGEVQAVQSTVDVLLSCLAAEAGCKVVPGLPEDQYFFTLGCSIAGGLVAGFVSKIPPQGFVQRRWVWLLLFSPLWASLFINFGLGPVVSRTADLAPLLGNTCGFAAAAAAVYVPQLLMQVGRPAEEGGSSGGPGGGGSS